MSAFRSFRVLLISGRLNIAGLTSKLIGSWFRVWGFALRATTPHARFKG